ncbi:CG34184, partial [Drosophila busckii]
MRLWSVCCYASLALTLTQAALLYPTNSEYGIFMAISVPVSLPHTNVFLSYNYEFNYYQPEHVYKFPPIIMGDNFEDSYLTYPTHDAKEGQTKGRQCLDNCTLSETAVELEQEAQTEATSEKATATEQTTAATAKREKRELSLMSRTSFYAMLRDKLARSGFGGESCLLRLICEVSATQLGEVNGVLGSLMHVLFSPSTSAPEQLPLSYYQAELDGAREDCQHYEQHCGESLLDLISEPFELILQ